MRIDLIYKFCSSLEASQSQFNNEEPLKTDQLVLATPASELPSDIRLEKLHDSKNIDFKSYSFSSSSISEDYQNQINQLQQKLSANEDKRTLLRERLNEVELEFRKTLDDHTAIITMNEEQLESLVQERDALVEQQVLQLVEK